MQRFQRGLVFKADRLCVSLNSRLESNKEEEEVPLHLLLFLLHLHLPPKMSLYKDVMRFTKTPETPVALQSLFPGFGFRAAAERKEGDRLRVLGGVPREQKMLKGHLPRVIYHHVD